MISMFQRMREREGGFTLVELLVVIVILGILIAIAVPTFLNQQNKAKEAKVQTYLNTAYKVAKSDSVANNGNYTTSSFTTANLATDITNSEPELGTVSAVTDDKKATLDAKLTQATPIVVVTAGANSTPGTSGQNLELVGLSDSGTYWKLAVTGNAAPVVSSFTPA